MNPFTPILPPGSPLARVPAQPRSRVRVAVFIVLAINIFALVLLLIQGCVHANRTTAVAGTAASKVVVSPETTSTPSAGRLPVTVPRAESQAPLVSAPVATPKPAPLLAAQGMTVKNYSVVKGDTYSKIAKANGVSVNALAKANPGVDPKKLQIGQVLHIPVVGQQETLPPPTSTHASVKDKQ